MLVAVGRVWDGLIGHPIFTRRYVGEVVRATLTSAAESVSRREPGIAGSLVCAVHDGAAPARREAEAQIAFYAPVRTHAIVMALHGFEENAQTRAVRKRHDRAAMIEAISDEMLDIIARASTPAEVKERFEERFARLYERTLLSSLSYGFDPGRLVENLDAIMCTFGIRGQR